MRHRTIIILLSLCVAFVFMTSGYSLWEKSLVIKTNIDVVAPPPPPEKKEADGKELKDQEKKDQEKDSKADAGEPIVEIIENNGEQTSPIEPTVPEVIQEAQDQNNETGDVLAPAEAVKSIEIDPIIGPDHSTDLKTEIK